MQFCRYCKWCRGLVGVEGVAVVDAAEVLDLNGEAASPTRGEGADTLVGVVSVTVDEVSVLVVDIEVEVGVAVAANHYDSLLATTEGDVVDVCATSEYGVNVAVGACDVAAYLSESIDECEEVLVAVSELLGILNQLLDVGGNGVVLLFGLSAGNGLTFFCLLLGFGFFANTYTLIELNGLDEGQSLLGGIAVLNEAAGGLDEICNFRMLLFGSIYSAVRALFEVAGRLLRGGAGAPSLLLIICP